MLCISSGQLGTRQLVSGSTHPHLRPTDALPAAPFPAAGCRLPERFRTNMARMYLVHCDLALWAGAALLLPWFTGSAWRKVEWVQRVEFLEEALTKVSDTSAAVTRSKVPLGGGVCRPAWRGVEENEAVKEGRGGEGHAPCSAAPRAGLLVALALSESSPMKPCTCAAMLTRKEQGARRGAHALNPPCSVPTLPACTRLAAPLQRQLAALLPDFVVEHDELLEDQPLMDYGVVASKEASMVPGMPAPL